MFLFSQQYVKPILREVFKSRYRSFFSSPLFVVSCGRSGSTALCRSLGRHPQILMAEREAPLFDSIGKTASMYAEGKASNYIQASVRISEWRFKDQLRTQCYTQVFGPDLGFDYNPFHVFDKKSLYSMNNHVLFWGAKTFPCEKSAKGLTWLYPKCKFIYLFRNGVDVVYSMCRYGSFAKLSFEQRCRFWATAVANYQYLLHNERCVSIRFEDFLNDPARIFSDIYNHLGIIHDPSAIMFAQTNHINPLDQPSVKRNPKNEILKRRESHLSWSANEKNIFKEICSEAMDCLGYEMPF